MIEFAVNNAWLLPALPLLGALVTALTGSRLKDRAHLPIVAGIGLAFLYSLLLLAGASPTATPMSFDWITISGLNVPLEFQVDGLTTMMLSMVTFVATLVAVFAAGYMHGDPGYTRFFAVVGLFVFAMTGLVLSANYLVTYAFWEGVGVCSYLLIGFWHAKPYAAAAAKKAFLVNRIGDVGFAIAIFWLWTTVANHDLSYANVLSASNLGAMQHADKFAIAFLLFWAATAKSAQLPLYVWLPDAMEGPTPVSALIHAATMVTAGVYLIARSSALIVTVPSIQMIVAVIGCLTALLAALIALTQTDLKRVMAYSTVSQLGYMFMGLGAGVGKLEEGGALSAGAKFAVTAAMFHLFTHAFFKALLFLGSGSVMHAMGGVIDMRRFRGLRHRLPYTCWTFAIGALTLAGLPPLSGFFSKDEILVALDRASATARGMESLGAGWGRVYDLIWFTALFTAGLTAFYTGRAFFLTFWGPEKLPSPDDPEAEPADDHGHGHDAHGHGDDHGHGHDSHFGHESGPMMTIPLMILAGCAVVVGALFGPLTHGFEHHLEKTAGFHAAAHVAEAGHAAPDAHAAEAGHGASAAAEHGGESVTMIASIVVGLAGVGLSYLFYGRPSAVPAQLASRLRPLYTASLNKFYVDEFYYRLVVVPVGVLANIAEFFDMFFVDGLVQLMAWIPRVVGRYVLGPLQNGLIQSYAAITAFGVSLVFLILLFFMLS